MKHARHMKPVNFRSRLPSIAAGVLLSVGPAIGHAVPVLVDFMDAAAAPSFGGTWNTIPDPSVTTQLVDAAGATTNITLAFSGNWFDSPHVSPWPHGNIAWIDANAAMDSLGYDFTAPPGHVVIAGLATDLVYRIDLLAVEEFFAPTPDSTADFSIFGSFGDSVPNGDNFDVHNDGLLGGKFMTWNIVAPNASGEILIEVAGFDAPPNDPSPQMLGTIVSAARITCLRLSAAGAPQEVNCPSAVPEPGSVALLALGLAGMLTRRRRLRRTE